MVTYEPEARPGVANLLELVAQCSPTTKTPADVASELEGARLADLKNLCADSIIAELDGVQERWMELLDRDGGRYLDEVAAAGAEVARRNAEETMRLVRSAVGLAPAIS